MSLVERIEHAGPKKLLAIEGGGVRCVLALEVLQRIEDLFKAKSGKADFRLADYFDYIAGTSTGGLIAAGLSIGMSVGEILAFYQDASAQMLVKADLLRRLRYEYKSEPLAAKLKEVFDIDTTLSSEKLRTLLLLVMRQRDHRLALAGLQQSLRQVQRWRTARLQPQIPALAAGAREHRGPHLLPARGHRAAEYRPCWRAGVHFCRRRRDHVQQSGFPDVLDGDARPLLGAKA
jgi:Patatin-like phospholipase